MRLVILLSIFSLFLSGCVIERRLYVPTQVNNPYLQKAGDYSISATYSNPTGFDVNGGIAITNHFALIAGYNNYKVTDKETESNIFSSNFDSAILHYKHKGFHAGVGGYFPLSKSNSLANISVFGGLIKNKFSMQEKLYALSPNPSTTPKQNFFDSDINRWFLQAGINLYPDIFQISFTSRFNYAGYENVNTDYDSNEQYSYNLPPVAYPKWSSFLDFSFDATCYFNKSKTLGVQLFSVLTTRLDRREYNFYYYPGRAGIGLVYKRAQIKKK